MSSDGRWPSVDATARRSMVERDWTSVVGSATTVALVGVFEAPRLR